MGGQGETAKSGRWALYDEKYITLPALAQHKYDSRKPLDWLQSLQDYVSGGSLELDMLGMRDCGATRHTNGGTSA